MLTNGQVSDDLQDGEPQDNAPNLLSRRPSVVTDALVGIQAHLHPVVEQGKEGARGQAATKMVMELNCRTGRKRRKRSLGGF